MNKEQKIELNYKNLGEYKNAFYKEDEDLKNRTLDDEIKRLRLSLEYKPHSFQNSYLVCSEKMLDKIVKYIQQKLEIPEDRLFKIQIQPESRNIRLELEKLSDNLMQEQGSKSIVVANGFELMVEKNIEREKESSNLHRWAHDYDQEMIERFDLEKKLSENGNKALVITHIDRDAKESYSAIKTAVLSQFRNSVIIIDEN